MKLYLDNYEQLKDVENFLFRFVYTKSFNLQILLNETQEQFNYRTVYNDFAEGLILETF